MSKNEPYKLKSWFILTKHKKEQLPDNSKEAASEQLLHVVDIGEGGEVGQLLHVVDIGEGGGEV